MEAVGQDLLQPGMLQAHTSLYICSRGSIEAGLAGQGAGDAEQCHDCLLTSQSVPHCCRNAIKASARGSMGAGLGFACCTYALPKHPQELMLTQNSSPETQ